MAILGTITGHLHISIGDGEAINVAQFQIPLFASAPMHYGPEVSIGIDNNTFNANLAEALHEAARYLEGGSK